MDIKLLIYAVYFIGMVYFAYEDLKYESIPAIPAILFALLTVFGDPISTFTAIFFVGIFYILRLFGTGDYLIMLPTIALFGGKGVRAVLVAAIILNIYGILARKDRVPYIPLLLVMVIICLFA